MKLTLPSPARLAAGTALLLLAACAENGNASRFDATSQGTLVATTRAASGSGTAPSAESAGDPEGVVRINGQLTI